MKRKTVNQAMDIALQALSPSVVLFASSFDNFSLFFMSFTKAYVLDSNVLVQLSLNKKGTYVMHEVVHEIITLSVFENSNFHGGWREKEQNWDQLKACNSFRLQDTPNTNIAKLWEINCVNILIRDKLNLSRITNRSLGIQYDYEDHIYKSPNYRIISWGSHASKYIYKIFLRSDLFLISMSEEAVVTTIDSSSLISLLLALAILLVILHISGLGTGWVLLIAEVFENGFSLTKEYMKFAVPLILWSFGNILLRQFYASDMVSNLAIPPAPIVPNTLEELLKYRKEIPTISYTYECLRNNTKNSLLRPEIYQINNILDKIGLIVIGSPTFTRNFTEERNISSDFAIFGEDEGMTIFEKVFALLMTLVNGEDSFKSVYNKHDSIESRKKYWTIPKSVFEAQVTKVIMQLEESGIFKKTRQLASRIKIMNFYSDNVKEILRTLNNTKLEIYKQLIHKAPRWGSYFSSDFGLGAKNGIPTTFQSFKNKSLQLVWYLYFALDILAIIACGLEFIIFVCWCKHHQRFIDKTEAKTFSFPYLR